MVKFPNWPNSDNIHKIALGLERITELLNRINNPHLRLPPTIHIAGTNGKGSTLAFLKSIFEYSGYKVHRYTSPHLVEFNERIEICGKIISDEKLSEYSIICKNACEQEPKINVTFFEATTAIAFLAFSEFKADILLLETGMGGEFDATNVLPQVFQSIITPISIDHQDFLGNDITSIAKAKAGIIKERCSVICNNSKLEILKIIKEYSNNKKANLILVDDYFKKNFFDFSKIQIPLRGSHQLQNLKTAICSIKNQKFFKISDENIIRSIPNTIWKARLQEIKSGKFFKKINSFSKLFLDGSHNVEGAKTIAEFLGNYEDYNKIIAIQMMKDKDCYEFIKIISKKVKKIFIINNFSNSKFYDANEIKKICQNIKIDSETINGFESFFDKISVDFNNQKNLILITGSLYQASEFLTENN